MQEWANDFYGEWGCCKTCDPDWKASNSREVDGICLCYECKCSFFIPITLSDELLLQSAGGMI